MKIAIDLGHGLNSDGGAVGYLNEEREVRAIAPFMAKRLEELGHTVKIIDIKSATGVKDSLRQRCEISNDWGADLFISMHLNAFKTTDKAMGCEVVAMSDKSAKIAAVVEAGIAKLGFKSRGVKRDELYVLKYTDCASILIESFFVDSKEDCHVYGSLTAAELGKAIGTQVSVALGGTGNANITPAQKKDGSLKVLDILGRCDTGLARALSLQVIAKCNRMVKTPALVEVKHPLIDVSSSAVNPWLQPKALADLVQAVEARNKPMVINSCYRTTVQQHILRQQFERGLCGLTAVAMPGKSNHEKGLAIDIEDAQGWKPFLEKQGWSWIGSFDPMHFDYWDGTGNLGSLGVSACQLLHNAHNKEQLAVDGSYGAKTAAAINQFPIDGWKE